MNLSVGALTDLAIHRFHGARIEEFTTHFEVHRDDHPHFRWGNFIQIRDETSAADVARWVDLYQRAFPGKSYLTFGLPNVQQSVLAAWGGQGFECLAEDNLVADDQPSSCVCPDGYVVRPVRDWCGHIDFALSVHPRNGRDFLRRQDDAAATLIDLHVAEYFAAYTDDGEIAARLGIVLCSGSHLQPMLARYQAVSTAPAHRRRGLATHLLGIAAEWAASEGAEHWVIVAHADSNAGRIYRRAGFRLAQQSFGVEKQLPC